MLEGVNVTKGKTPAKVISYIDGKQERTYFGKNTLILFKNNNGLYSFTVDSEFDDIMLIRLLGQDTFQHFTLKYGVEHPQQILVYEVKI